jgi:hypothetical protein
VITAGSILHTLLMLYQITVKYTAATLSILIDGQISAKHMLTPHAQIVLAICMHKLITISISTDYFSGYVHIRQVRKLMGHYQ